MPDALAGVRVLDFTQAWAGPTAARLLGDFGADVIKVESETRPDLGRLVGPHVGDEFDIDASGYFVEWNRNKRSIRLNLREPEDVALAQRLAATCDAVVENFAPGVMARLSLDYETLCETNPALVMLSLSGFGATGPLCRAPAFGQQIEAISGLMSVTGYVDGPPLKPGVSYPDPLSGIAGAAAVVAALRERRRSGRGRWLDMSMLEITAAQLSEPLVSAQLTGSAPQALGNASSAYAPHGIYRCEGTDSWIAIECRDEEEWRGLLRVLGEDSELADVHFATAATRLEHRDALDSAVSDLVSARIADDLAVELQAEGTPAARVATIADTFADEHLRARGFWVPVEHPKVGAVDTAGPMAVLSETPARVRVQPALLGEHSGEIVEALPTVEAERALNTDASSAEAEETYLPLAGTRVIELASDVAGPYTGKLLAALGADVIKVESAEGDPLR
ncbi:MAG: CoA transferase, partial [Gaiellaceae bacterium]